MERFFALGDSLGVLCGLTLRWSVRAARLNCATDNDGNDIVMHLLEYNCNEMAEWVRKQGA